MKKYISQKRCRAALLLLALLVSLGLSSCAAPADNTAAGPETTVETRFDGSLGLGDTMPELSVTTAQGKTLTLSQLLQKKKLVVLNFWFADCGWCLREFPAMEVAYQSCKADVEILALNPMDTAADIKAFQEARSLSFPMAACSRDLALSFGVNGYPTSVLIDRYGTVSLVHTGAITDAGTFRSIFNAFTADDYQPTVCTNGIEDLLDP